MSRLEPTPTPVLCRLCRRPIPRLATKCPYCRARLLWRHGSEGPPPLSRWARRLRLTGLAAAIVASVAIVAVWAWVLREVKAPFSSTDTTKTTAGRPTSADCAALVGVLTGSERVTPDLREKFRQCFQRR